jgi:hypothetical protein
MRTEIPAGQLVDEISTFLVAAAAVLREAIMRYEKTTARITEHVANRPNEANRDLIVTLQEFDRLHQEFAAIAEVLTSAAAKPSESWRRAEGGVHPAEDAIANISIADLKERMMRRLGISMIDLTMLVPTGEEVEF